MRLLLMQTFSLYGHVAIRNSRELCQEIKSLSLYSPSKKNSLTIDPFDHSTVPEGEKLHTRFSVAQIMKSWYPGQ